MIRVLISTSTFPIRLDDALPRFVYDLAQSLTGSCEVTVLAPDAPGALREEKMGDVSVRRFTYFLPRAWQALAYGDGMRQNIEKSFVAKFQPPSYILRQACATRSIVRGNRIQVVNSHWTVPQGLSTALARGPGRRFAHVLSVHAGDVYMLEKLPFGRALARFIIGRTDFVFSSGSHVRDRLDKLLGFASNAVVQPMGVRTELFGRSQNVTPVPSPFPDGYLLFFGRFAEKKGVVYLLRALPKVRERYPGLGLIIIGYGAEEGALRRETSALGIEDAVEFAGRKPHEEIVGYLHGCRVAVVPSIVDSKGETEGMPTVVAEAMAAGVRVVACAVDGIPDVIRHGENGWLCREKDPEDLAGKILEALSDPEPSRIVQNALDTAARLDWANVGARYLEAFERLAHTPVQEDGVRP